MGNASPLWCIDISSCWALAVQSWAGIKLQGHTSSRNILLLLFVPFVHMLRAGLTSISFEKRSSHGQWLEPHYYVEVVSWLLKMVGFSSTSSTLPFIVCGVVDLVTRLTSEASRACISFLNVLYLFSGWLFVLPKVRKWFHFVVQCKLAMNLCSSWSGNNHSFYC